MGERGPLVASDYLLAEGVTYLNHASIGTIPRIVHEAHIQYLAACESNPWLHIWGDAWGEAHERVHQLAADLLGTDKDQVAIIRNATAAFGMAANGLPLGPKHEVLFSSLNHVGASASWSDAASARGFGVRRFPFPGEAVASQSVDDVTALYLDAIRDETEALVLPHVDNTFGIRHDVAAIARGARERGVRWILVDGAQSVGMHRVDVAGLGVDVYATSAHKWLQAPKGTGLMALSTSAIEAMRPLVTSWGQRSWQGTARALTDFGTRDLAKVLTVGDAIELHQKTGGAITEEGGANRGATGKTREHCYRELRSALADRVASDARTEWRSPVSYDEMGASISAIGLRKGSAKAIARSLFEEDGIVVRGFEGNHQNHLRVSPGAADTLEDIDRFWQALCAKLE